MGGDGETVADKTGPAPVVDEFVEGPVSSGLPPRHCGQSRGHFRIAG
jgi:hypothetical protein